MILFRYNFFCDDNYEFLSEIFKNSNTITILLKCNYFMKSMIISSLIIAIVFTNVSLLTKVTAESGIGKDVFKVIVSLLGITNSTGRSTLWVIDFKKGIAKKPILDHDVERTIKARYPTCRTHLDIEDYLLGLFCDNGFDIRLDVRNRKRE